MDQLSPPLLSKFYIPQPRQTLVHRPRLIQRLIDGLRSSLSLVSAPPGFGKTTLLAEWAATLPANFSSDYRLEADYLQLAHLRLAEKDYARAKLGFWAFFNVAISEGDLIMFSGT